MPHLAPTTLTADEQRAILARHRRQPPRPRHLLLALGTGLRLAEIVGLNVGDVFAPDGTPRVRVRIRAEIAKGGRAADVFLPDRLVAEAEEVLGVEAARGESLDPGAPLFCNQSRRRISKRRVQFAWRTWQMEAGFDRLYPFHCTRHAAITNVYRASHDLFLAQRFARHVSPADHHRLHPPERRGDGEPPGFAACLARQSRSRPIYRGTQQPPPHRLGISAFGTSTAVEHPDPLQAWTRMYSTPALHRSHIPMSKQMSPTVVATPTFQTCSGLKTHFPAHIVVIRARDRRPGEPPGVADVASPQLMRLWCRPACRRS